MAIKAKKVKYSSRERNKYRIRKRVYGTGDRPRISVFKSSKHIYAQIISDMTGETLASASTLEKEVIEVSTQIPKEQAHNDSRSSKSVAAARAVGKVLAKRGLEKNLTEVIFDRNGFIYKGRISAVAEGAREGGLKF